MSHSIVIVGLGPGDSDRITVGARRALNEASRIFVRSHPGLDLSALLDLEGVTDVGSLRQPDDVPGGRWHAAALAVCDAVVDGPVALAIPGHPRIGEGLVVDVLGLAAERGLSATVLDGISAIDQIANALGVDPLLDGVQCFVGRMLVNQLPSEPFAGGVFTGTPGRPMLFTHVYDAETMAAVARSLSRIFPADHPVVRADAAGLPEQSITAHAVGELATVPAGPMVALWVPAMKGLSAGRDPRTLQHISARLRAPDGCPWDRAQTHQSLRNEFLDEVYEVLDAIDAGHTTNLAEELGDIFLHIVLQAQIAEEAGEFTLEDVYEGVAAKIVRRHPHVFAGERADTQADLSRIWKRVKAEEKLSAPADKPEKDVDGEPRSMPALTRASRVLARHPVTNERRPRSAEKRASNLLNAIAAIVDAGDDPEIVLREALATHVEDASARSS